MTSQPDDNVLKRMKRYLDYRFAVRGLFFGFACLILLVGCSNNNYAPVRDLEKPRKVLWGSHRVQKSETLYYIAWRYGRDYRELASINRIPFPYLIKPGQVISLRAKSVSSKSRYTAKTNKKAQVKLPSTKKKSTYKPAYSRVKWTWPLRGKISGRFTGANGSNKGIDIKAAPGTAVKAAAGGVVVYSGNGLIGYGNLVIIKHSETYLSAYAHNKRIFVKEKNNVKAGQKIAEIGSTGASYTKLHFEIRKNGKPVNPLQYLPKS